MIELAEIDQIAFFRLGLTRVHQSVRSEWSIQDGGQLLSKNVPFWSVPPLFLKPVGRITSRLGHRVILGSSMVSQTLTLGWPRVTLNSLGGFAL